MKQTWIVTFLSESKWLTEDKQIRMGNRPSFDQHSTFFEYLKYEYFEVFVINGLMKIREYHNGKNNDLRMVRLDFSGPMMPSEITAIMDKMYEHHTQKIYDYMTESEAQVNLTWAYELISQCYAIGESVDILATKKTSGFPVEPAKEKSESIFQQYAQSQSQSQPAWRNILNNQISQNP